MLTRRSMTTAAHRRTGTSGQARVRWSRFRSVITALATGLAVLASLPAPASAGDARQGRQVAYLTNQGNDTVSVVDITTNTVIATIPVGGAPTGVAAGPGGRAGTVSVIDTATNTVIATVPVGTQPFGVAVTAGGTRAYVCNVDSMSVIDTATNTVIATLSLPEGPFEIAIAEVP